MTVPFRLDPVSPGVFEGTVRLDLTEAPLPLQGFAGVRHPLVRLQQQGLSNSGLLLAPLTFPVLTARIEYRSGAAPHELTIEPEGRNPGRLQLRWRPVGVTAHVIRPVVQKIARPRVRKAAKLLSSVLR
jgi:hypothetical protein